MKHARAINQEPGASRHRKRSILPGCLAVGCGLPMLTVLTLWLVFRINNRPPNLFVPTPPPLANNAYNDFVRAAQLAKAIKHKSPLSMRNPPMDDAGLLKVAAACAKDATPALAVMRQGLTKPCQTPPSRSIFGYYPHSGALRELARTIAGTELFYELSGQPDRAMETLLDGAEMGVMLSRGGGTIETHLSSACETLALNPFEKILPRLSPAELTRTGERLNRIAAKRESYENILLEESSITIASWQEALRDPKGQGIKKQYEFMRTIIDTPEEERSKWTEQWKILNYTLASKSAMLREIRDYYRALAAEANSPYQGKSKVIVPHNPLAQLSEVSEFSRPSFLYRQTLFDLLRVETALCRYKAATGRFPGTLSQLLTTYLKAVPDDPFGGSVGKTFRYEARDGGRSFLLYSLGADLVDNGGQPTYSTVAPTANFSGRMTASGDIVAGHLYPPKKH